MYTSFPPRQRMVVRATLTLAWALVLLGGIASALSTPRPVLIELGSIMTLTSGILVAGSAGVAALGVAFDVYRMEWIAAYGAAAGMVPYVVASWWLVFSDYVSPAQALYTTAILVFLTLRAQFCAAHAAKLRAQHKETGTIDVVP